MTISFKIKGIIFAFIVESESSIRQKAILQFAKVLKGGDIKMDNQNGNQAPVGEAPATETPVNTENPVSGQPAEVPPATEQPAGETTAQAGEAPAVPAGNELPQTESAPEPGVATPAPAAGEAPADENPNGSVPPAETPVQ